MIAIDTNIVVRFLVADAPDEFEKARQLMSTQSVLVTPTVLLETVWVLVSKYRLPQDAVMHALRGVIGLPSVHLSHPEAALKALDWFGNGVDIADAIHIAHLDGADRFVTFDKHLVRKAVSQKMPIEVVHP